MIAELRVQVSSSWTGITIVMAGLDPAIHLLLRKVLRRLMDTRVKPAYDDCEYRNAGLSRYNCRCPHIAPYSSASTRISRLRGMPGQARSKSATSAFSEAPPSARS